MYARAGWAMVELWPDGSPKCALYGPVWAPLKQTSPVAEHVAFCALVQKLKEPAVVVTDFKALMTNFWRGRQSLRPTSSLAGLWRDARVQEGFKAVRRVVWQKAHTGDAQNPEKLSYDVRGNFEADKFAKLGAQLHPSWSNDELREIEQLHCLFKFMCNSIACALTSWVQQVPKTNVSEDVLMFGVSSVVRQPLQKLRTKSSTHDQQHTFFPWHPQPREGVHGIQVVAQWRCMCCLVVVRSLSSRAAKDRCKGHAHRIRATTDPARMHRLVVAELRNCSQHSFVIACSRCGSWTTQNPRNLLENCTGRKTTRGKADYAALLHGIHPLKKGVEVGTLSLLAPDLFAELV